MIEKYAAGEKIKRFPFYSVIHLVSKLRRTFERLCRYRWLYIFILYDIQIIMY